ncbi:MAG: carboxymuconolactone decarboxylase family protein [Ferrimicrobium sp.]
MSEDLSWIATGYEAFFGHTPDGIDTRIAVSQATGRTDALTRIERARETLIYNNPLGGRTGQLVHFAQLLVLGHGGPARLHARSAIHHGASITDLEGVCELSLITGGVPAYSLGITILGEILAETNDI